MPDSTPELDPPCADDLAGLDPAPLRALLKAGPRPLFATVSGAHLYGFASPDSDVDLRGAFVAPLRAVIGLNDCEETRVVTGEQGGLELDWVAHDVRKFARLMTRRNGYVLEQLYSPLVVWGGPWLAELKAIGAGCVVRDLVHHYRGFARNQRKELSKPGATVKALLYAYRVYGTGIWLLRSGRVQADLAALSAAVPELPPAVPALIERKRAGAEKAALDRGELAAHTPALDRLEEALTQSFEQSALPAECGARAALDDYVARARLELGQ